MKIRALSPRVVQSPFSPPRRFFLILLVFFFYMGEGRVRDGVYRPSIRVQEGHICFPALSSVGKEGTGALAQAAMYCCGGESDAKNEYVVSFFEDVVTVVRVCSQPKVRVHGNLHVVPCFSPPRLWMRPREPTKDPYLDTQVCTAHGLRLLLPPENDQPQSVLWCCCLNRSESRALMLEPGCCREKKRLSTGAASL